MFEDEVIKLENKMVFYFKYIKEDIKMSKEDEEGFQNNPTRLICGKEFSTDKVRDHCLLTGKYRGLTHNNCNTNVTQKQISFIPFLFHLFSYYDCHLVSKKIFDGKIDKENLILYLKRMKNTFQWPMNVLGWLIVIDSYEVIWKNQ